MKRIVTLGIVVGIFATAVDAQISERRRRIQDEILEKQRNMREGKMVRANVRVTVRLNNGSRLRGVVKNGRFVERIDAREFVEARRPGPKSGLRLWYYDDTDSYIFLPYRSVKNYKIGERLTDEEVKRIEKRIAESRRKADAKRKEFVETRDEQRKKRAEAEAQKRKQQAAAKPGAETGAPKVEDSSNLTPAQRQLLSEFPPDQGWGLDKLKSLEQRKVTLGVFPRENEQKFIDNFGVWNEAFETWQAEKESKQVTPSKQDAPAPTSRPTRKPYPTPAPTPAPTPTPAPPFGGPGSSR